MSKAGWDSFILGWAFTSHWHALPAVARHLAARHLDHLGAPFTVTQASSLAGKASLRDISPSPRELGSAGHSSLFQWRFRVCVNGDRRIHPATESLLS